MCWQGATLLGREEECVRESERAEGRDNTPLWALVSSSASASPVSLAVAVDVGGGSRLQSPKEAECGIP